MPSPLHRIIVDPDTGDAVQIVGGKLQVDTGGLTIGEVDQGAAGVEDWLVEIAREAGTWSYAAGTSGTASPTGRVLMFTAIAGDSSASVAINGGTSIPIPANAALTIQPRGNLVSPTIVFTDTVSYFVELVS